MAKRRLLFPTRFSPSRTTFPESGISTDPKFLKFRILSLLRRMSSRLFVLGGRSPGTSPAVGGSRVHRGNRLRIRSKGIRCSDARRTPCRDDVDRSCERLLSVTQTGLATVRSTPIAIPYPLFSAIRKFDRARRLGRSSVQVWGDFGVKAAPAIVTIHQRQNSNRSVAAGRESKHPRSPGRQNAAGVLQAARRSRLESE
jgi:hypothetical protein